MDAKWLTSVDHMTVDLSLCFGILAGICPCGIITLAGELFLSESNSQVNGSIHSLLHANPAETSDISKLVLKF